MSERIYELIVVTRNADGTPQIAPMGVRERDGFWLIAPFRPSRTLDNLLRDGSATLNVTDDVRIYAGCLTGRHDWPLTRCETIDGWHLSQALSHREVVCERVEEDAQRPRIYCRTRLERSHRPFRGFVRAQAAVLELAILVSRLDRLPWSKVEQELAYLEIALAKTAGPAEREAWAWLRARIEAQRAARTCA